MSSITPNNAPTVNNASALNNAPTFVLGQAGREGLTNFAFILEAPWKACRLCGTVFQTTTDRIAYRMHQRCKIGTPDSTHHLCEVLEVKGRALREEWLRLHNKSCHTQDELEAFAKSGIDLTPESAQKLASYGIIHINGSTNEIHLVEESQALFEAPRAPINDCEGR